MTYMLRREFRLGQTEDTRLDILAKRSGRTASQVIRLLINAVDPERVTTGFPAPTLLEAEAAERELLRSVA